MKKVSGNMTKKEFQVELQKQLKELLDVNVSLDKAYGIFKLCTLLPYHLAHTKDIKVTLAGLGVFRIYETPAGNITPKYYGGETVRRVLTNNNNLLGYVTDAQAFRNPNGTITPKETKEVEEPKETKKPAKKSTPKKTSKKKVEIEKEIVDEVEDDDILGDLDDFIL